MDYYIYLYWRLDTNEVFYVGKGCNDRWKKLNRENKHFNNIVNKHPIAVEIVKDNLTEEQAFYWEEDIIRQLVFEYGYSIDIKNNRSSEKDYHLVNATWGGEGVSGLNPRDYMTEEAKIEQSRKLSEAHKGKNPRDYMTEETKKERDRKASESMKGKNSLENMTDEQKEERNRKISEANKGKNPLDYMTEEVKKERDRKISEAMKGKNNPQAKSVIAIINDKIFGVFDYATQGAEYFNCANSGISRCCKGKRNYCGKYNGYKIVWRYIEIIEL